MDLFKGHWFAVLCFGVCQQMVDTAEVVLFLLFFGFFNLSQVKSSDLCRLPALPPSCQFWNKLEVTLISFRL